MTDNTATAQTEDFNVRRPISGTSLFEIWGLGRGDWAIMKVGFTQGKLTHNYIGTIYANSGNEAATAAAAQLAPFGFCPSCGQTNEAEIVGIANCENCGGVIGSGTWAEIGEFFTPEWATNEDEETGPSNSYDVTVDNHRYHGWYNVQSGKIVQTG